MAKTPETNATNSAPAADASAQIAAIDVGPSSGRSDSRSIMLKVPMTDGTERSMSRTEYIRTRWAQGVDRGTIRKEVCKLQNKDVPYQVIFGATKNQPGGPPNQKKKESSGEGATA